MNHEEKQCNVLHPRLKSSSPCIELKYSYGKTFSFPRKRKSNYECILTEENPRKHTYNCINCFKIHLVAKDKGKESRIFRALCLLTGVIWAGSSSQMGRLFQNMPSWTLCWNELKQIVVHLKVVVKIWSLHVKSRWNFCCNQSC